MLKGQKVSGGDRLGKTIMFAKNNDHADFIAKRFDINYPQYKGHFARVVTYKTEYVQSLIDDFSAKDKAPHIAISVDMLDTGIDVEEVVNLVFFKIVRSKTKFWQMLGRGTRLYPDLFGPGEDKECFYIFDFCQNLEFFSQNPNISDGSSGEPLSTRLFKNRLELITDLDKRIATACYVREPVHNDHALSITETELRAQTAGLLHKTVQSMSLDNFVVRPQRAYVEKFAREETWHALGQEEVHELTERIAGLPSQLVDDDEEAKRFDMLVLRTQLSVLKGGSDFRSLKDKIQNIASSLEEESAIPAVKAEMVLIQAVAGDEWWQDVTVTMLEQVRRKLRALIKLIPKGQKKVVYTDFEDELGVATSVELPQVTANLNMAKFKEKARQFLKAHQSHLSLHRLRTNQPLTPTDLEELEKMLLQAGGSPSQIQEAKQKSHGLGLFIRSLVGLDREAAMQAFSGFINGTTATPNQIEFIDLIVQELMQAGVMEPERLFQSPFTDVNAQGPFGLFQTDQVDQIVKALEEIKKRAAA